MTTSIFDRQLYGFRFVEVRYGETIQRLAARELGDAARWIEIVNYNGLVAPFFTDDPALAGNGVVLSGSLVRVPAPSPVIDTTIDPDEVFGTDVYLQKGLLTEQNGDLMLVSGRENLRQALKNRMDTETGELIFHMDYGSRVRTLIGAVNGPTASQLAAKYGRAAMQRDDRVQRVSASRAVVTGNRIQLTVQVEPVSGSPLDVSTTI